MPWFKFFQETGRSEEEEKRIFERLIRNLAPEQQLRRLLGPDQPQPPPPPSQEADQEPIAPLPTYDDEEIKRHINRTVLLIISLRELAYFFSQKDISGYIKENPSGFHKACKVAADASIRIIQMLNNFSSGITQNILPALDITEADVKPITNDLLIVVENASRILGLINDVGPLQIQYHIPKIMSHLSDLARALNKVGRSLNWENIHPV